MKTAEEWREEFPILIGGNDKEQVIVSYTSFIQEIQLDAMKEGMRRASAVARHAGSYANEHAGCDAAANAILSAAEQLTEKDL